MNFGKVGKAAHRKRLRINGATEAEIDFLLHGEGNTGQRVELNAMTSDQFVAFVESKLTEHGAVKVVPSAETLAGAYAAFRRGAMATAALDAELARVNAVPVDVPDDLAERVRGYLHEHPKETWDNAFRGLIEDERYVKARPRRSLSRKCPRLFFERTIRRLLTGASTKWP